MDIEELFCSPKIHEIHRWFCFVLRILVLTWLGHSKCIHGSICKLCTTLLFCYSALGRQSCNLFLSSQKLSPKRLIVHGLLNQPAFIYLLQPVLFILFMYTLSLVQNINKFIFLTPEAELSEFSSWLFKNFTVTDCRCCP